MQAGLQPVESEWALQPAPEDGVSSLAFAPSTNSLAAACWDAKLRVYDASHNRQVHALDTRAACLDCCFVDNTHGAAGTLEGAVRLYDFNQATAAAPGLVVGTHEKAVRCVAYSPVRELLFSGGWDAAVKAWDVRAPGAVVAALSLPNKVFTMDLTDRRLVVGTAERRVVSYDLRNLAQPEFDREASLKFQTRCIRTMPDGSGFALASIEGRIAVEYFSPEAEAKKYAFKCHRVQNTVFPVNAIAFHRGYGTFATGGCDGFVNIWDGQNKKRLCQLPCFPTSVAALSFNHDGTLLAVASSYTFEEGEKDHPPDQIFIHQVADAEVKPKPRTSAPST